MDITEVSIVHHIALVLFLLWAFFRFWGWCNPFIYFVALLYLYQVNERYTVRLQRKLQFEERKTANQRRLLSNTESVRWLNHAVEKIWPICMEQIASQQFLLPIIPWFLDKYKPWTAKKAVVQHLYLGRNPPMFTDIRVLGGSADGDHLVLELGMSFLAADDMSAILAVQLRKRLGFGITTNMHVTGMHVEGKILVGIKFLRHWPFLGRVRICFVEPPYFQMTVKPIFGHGLDVTELPGVSGWLDNLLDVAFGQTLVEPNMLVIDVEKFVSAPEEGWFTVKEKRPVAYVKLEILEGADMKPSDLNGLADPYVKGHLGSYRFQTNIQRKTLSPKWLEEFKIPISSWEAPNVLVLQVRDKDPIFDDILGDCTVNVNDLKDEQRHDMWLSLRNIKMGRIHLAITVLKEELQKEQKDLSDEEEKSEKMDSVTSVSSAKAENKKTEEYQKLADEYEPINIEGQERTGIWVHHPGSDVSQTWESRKGRVWHHETQIHCEDNASTISTNTSDNNTNGHKENIDVKKEKHNKVKRGFGKLSNVFHKSSAAKDSPKEFREEVAPTPRPNITPVGEKRTSVKLVVDESFDGKSRESNVDKESCSPEMAKAESPGKGNLKSMSKNIISRSSKNLRNALSGKGTGKLKEEQLLSTEDVDDSQRLDDSNGALIDDPLVIGGSPINISSISNHSNESVNTKHVLLGTSAETGKETI